MEFTAEEIQTEMRRRGLATVGGNTPTRSADAMHGPGSVDPNPGGPITDPTDNPMALAKRAGNRIAPAAEAVTTGLGRAANTMTMGGYGAAAKGWEKLLGREGQPGTFTADNAALEAKHPLVAGGIDLGASLVPTGPLARVSGLAERAVDPLVSAIYRRASTGLGRVAATAAGGAAKGALVNTASNTGHALAGEQVASPGDAATSGALFGGGFELAGKGMLRAEEAMRAHDPELQMLHEHGLQPGPPGVSVMPRTDAPPELRAHIKATIPKGDVTPATRAGSARRAGDVINKGYAKQGAANTAAFGERRAALSATEGQTMTDASDALGEIHRLAADANAPTRSHLEAIVREMHDKGAVDEHGRLLMSADAVDQVRKNITEMTGKKEFAATMASKVPLMQAAGHLRDILAPDPGIRDLGPGPLPPEAPRANTPPGIHSPQSQRTIDAAIAANGAKPPRPPARIVDDPRGLDRLPDIFPPEAREPTSVTGMAHAQTELHGAKTTNEVDTPTRALTKTTVDPQTQIEVGAPMQAYPKRGAAPGIHQLNSEYGDVQEGAKQRLDLLGTTKGKFPKNASENARAQVAGRIAQRGEVGKASGTREAEGGHAIDRLQAMGAEMPVLPGARSVEQNYGAALDAPRLQLAMERQQLSPGHFYSTAKRSGGLLSHALHAGPNRMLYPALRAGGNLEAGSNVVGADALTTAIGKRKKRHEESPQ